MILWVRIASADERRRGAPRGPDEEKPSMMDTQIPATNDVEALQALRLFAPAMQSKPLDLERVLAPIAAGIRRADA